MQIGLSYDLKDDIETSSITAEDALEEYDSRETVELIATALIAGGHQVVMLGGGREFLNNILRHKVDFVFNIAEGRGNYRSREAQVPAILEMLGVPYTGSDPLCLATCLDKPLTKKLVALEGVTTPKWQLVADRNELGQIHWQDFNFPVIIKPAHEGSSKGIRLASVAEDFVQAAAEADRIFEFYHQPVMVEEFINGDEVTIGVIGNSPPEVLGAMRILPKNKNRHFVYSLEVKRDYKNLVEYQCPARLDSRVLEEIRLSSLKVFQTLGCRDFARIDFRISPEGIPYFIEINPLPGLGTHSDLVIMAIKLGRTHTELVNAVLGAALKRYPQCVPA
jgi:D-alanine-D-alanine ligase